MHYLLVNIFCALTLSTTSPNAERAQQILDALYKYYATPNTCLLRGNYPSDQNTKATYLASEEQAKGIMNILIFGHIRVHSLQ